MPSARVELVQIPARDPAGELDRVPQAERIAQIVQRAGEEAVQPAHHQAEFRMGRAEPGEGAQQAIEVLVRMQRRNREQERFGTAAARDVEKNRIHAQGR